MSREQDHADEVMELEEASYEKSDADTAYLKSAFRSHTLPAEGLKRLTLLRAQTAALAELIIDEVPPGRERSLALTKCEEAMFWANAGLSRGEGK